MKKYLLICLSFFIMKIAATAQDEMNKAKFVISIKEGMVDKPVDGRLLLMFSNNDEEEPRFQINDGLNSQLIFGMNVNGMTNGYKIVMNEDAFGYPIESLNEIPPGNYYVQALLHEYETFKRPGGATIKLPMDRGEGQRWNRAPGNLYSIPQLINITSSKKLKRDETETFSLVLDQKIPPIEPPADTKYVKHIRIQSELLTKFWGRPMYLGAHVLLPEGFDENPEVKYPLAIMHGHFPYDFGGFREDPPDPDLKPEYSERFKLEGYNKIVQQEAYDFYKQWTGPDFPRVLAIEVQHANPFYDDSYAVNSENVGPYGDAITYELIPYIEEKFRGIGEGWARFVYGGSTGGWEALAVQVLYPKEYNGCYAACPDPIDFRAYCLINIYEDENAYFVEGQHKKVERPARRDYLGHVTSTVRSNCLKELAIGDKNRSGDQWDIWEAVYSPMAPDGYPTRLWDRKTGVIDKEVAKYWQENYDLAYIMKRDWSKIGDDLKGKVHIYCGDMDNYYLNNAVYLTEDFLKSTTEPYYDGEVDYGDRAEHCWNGDHTQPNAISRLRYHQMFIKKWSAKVGERAPAGADLKSWRY